MHIIPSRPQVFSCKVWFAIQMSQLWMMTSRWAHHSKSCAREMTSMCQETPMHWSNQRFSCCEIFPYLFHCFHNLSTQQQVTHTILFSFLTRKVTAWRMQLSCLWISFPDILTKLKHMAELFSWTFHPHTKVRQLHCWQIVMSVENAQTTWRVITRTLQPYFVSQTFLTLVFCLHFLLLLSGPVNWDLRCSHQWVTPIQ